MTEHYFQTLIIGSGAAAYNAAHWMKISFKNKPEHTFALVTEGRKKGTSRNTGSDKQTYYKLSISGNETDSVYSMAETLFSGGGMDGDIALCEAAGSVQSFLKLANLGIPFPTNDFGEFVGYKTDHDPFHRATSAGPLTSKYMVEYLEQEIEDVPYFDGYMVCKILVEENQVCGVLALCLEDNSFHLFHGNQVIWATGGPASAYFYSVFPGSQTGMTGALLEVGATGKNLGEWQYGLASVKFRWNVSGSYQQVIPRYFSTDSHGNEYDFLENVENALDFVFLKGYQWPFDVKKVEASSKIDKLVHEQFLLGRKVFMDFRVNSKGFDFGVLSPETYEYLKKSDILFGTPIERLEKMNPLAIEIYRNHDIDLYQEPLEVMVCAQHHNGGIDVDVNWETCVSGLYACGEVAATLGVYRPGGSALNSSQVGSMRAVSHIKRKNIIKNVSSESGKKIVENFLEQLEKLPEKKSSLSGFYVSQREEMSTFAAHIRDIERMEVLHQKTRDLLRNFWSEFAFDREELPLLFKTYDLLVTQCALLNAMILAGDTFGSRGSALVLGDNIEGNDENLKILTKKVEDGFVSTTEPVRDIPKPNNWFETVWAEYREKNKEN